MKHFALLFVLLVGCYVGWQFAPKLRRDNFIAIAKRHGIVIWFIAAVLFALLSAAVYLPSRSIF